jgi:hypothetical protein
MRHSMAAIALLATALMPAAAIAAGPPRGVYECYETRMNARMQLTFEVRPVVMFGLIDGTTYSDYDGKTGHYAYDTAAEILTMTDGSRQGWRYKHVADWSFRMLDQAGKDTSFTCPLNAAKDPLKRPW